MLYIAGPMSGIPHFNFPAFEEAATQLRIRDWCVTSPAELDSPASKAAAERSVTGNPDEYADGDTWGDLLARDVKMIADGGIEGIAVLPGWEKSRGARLETFVARLCGLPIYRYPEMDLVTDVEIDVAHASAPPETHCQPAPATGEVRIVDMRTGGQKGQKPQQFNLIPWEELANVAELYARGAAKYSAHNWRKGYAWSLSFDSLIRHAMAFWGGEELDPETECMHLASVVFHCFALMYFGKHHAELDDRP